MRIAVISEISTAARNADILHALQDTGHEIFNVGMTSPDSEMQLSIVETGFLSALMLNLKCVDLIIGGCGTGQGYFNCATQYPGVTCGLINDPLNAWLFPQINHGNCVSLALNKDYGWGGDVNLKFILERLLSAPRGGGYPKHREEPQKLIRTKMESVNAATHYSFDEILHRIDSSILRNALLFPGVFDTLRKTADASLPLYRKIEEIYQRIQ